ncbi:MAG: hypothetical protein JW712_03495 [Dehalococcoidales bacterium]|nr:hypothetical protein [Dehalococcoidales bacterium]
MAIKGISEVIRLPRLGKIRLGIRVEDEAGNSYPVSTDYFVCPDEVKKVFGAKPKQLRVMFPTEDEKQWASQYLRCYSEAGDLLCRGDGETAVAKVEAINQEANSKNETLIKLREISCTPDRCLMHKQGYCRRIMNLQFLLPECPGFGVYQLDTGSYHSIVNINSSLELIRGVCGRLAMIPLYLKLIEQEAIIDGEKKTIHVLGLTTPCSLAEIQKYAQTPPGQALLLPVPDSELPDDLFAEEGEYVSGWVVLAEQLENTERKLAELWTGVKSKVWRLDVSDAQINDWFKRNYRIDVRLSDLELIVPPAQVTLESLEHFLKVLSHQEDHS